MPTITRAPLARHLAAAVAAGALVLAPATAALADPTPSPSPTVTATATASPTAPAPDPSPSETVTEAPSATTDLLPVPTTVPAEPTATPQTSPSAPGAAKRAAEAAPGLVPGGNSHVFGRAAAAGPAVSTDPTLLGAHYLEQQLVDSDYLLTITFDDIDYPQYGLVADAVLALDAAGSGQDAAAAATQVLTENVVNYVGFGDSDEIASGAVAKLLNVAVAQGVDPTEFGGFDLVSTLEGLEQANGRFTDQSAFGDYSNTFGQSFALIGLSRAGSGPDAAAVDFTEAQQCPGGGFSLGMGDAGCSDDSLADPDSTSMAVQALIAAGGESSVISDALDYLASQQQGDGGVGGSGPTSATNANSTGLAGQAFLAGGRSAQARLAVSYLEGLQYGCSFPAALRGGVAYDPGTFASQQEDGEKAAPSDQDRRSTSQALLALAGTPLGSVTSAGADAVAPEPECAAPSPSPSASTSASASPSTSASTTPTSGSGSTSSTEPVAVPGGSTPTGALAQTGSELLLPVGLGALLVVAGIAAVLASRRRGAHA